MNYKVPYQSAWSKKRISRNIRGSIRIREVFQFHWKCGIRKSISQNSQI